MEKNYLVIAPWANFSDFAQVRFVNSVSDPTDENTDNRLAGIMGAFFIRFPNEEAAQQASEQGQAELTPEAHEALRVASLSGANWFENRAPGGSEPSELGEEGSQEEGSEAQNGDLGQTSDPEVNAQTGEEGASATPPGTDVPPENAPSLPLGENGTAPETKPKPKRTR